MVDHLGGSISLLLIFSMDMKFLYGQFLSVSGLLVNEYSVLRFTISNP